MSIAPRASLDSPGWPLVFGLGVRPVTHLAADRVEHALGLARSWLDQRHRDT
jgi:hypothetical protein